MYKLQIVILQAFKDKHFRAWDLGRWDLVWELPFPSTIVCSTSTCCQPIFLYFAGNEQQFTKRCLLKSYNSRWWNCLQYQGLNAGHPFSCLFFSECSWNCTHKVHTYLCHILPVHSGGMMSWMGPVLQLLQPKVNQDWLYLWSFRSQKADWYRDAVGKMCLPARTLPSTSSFQGGQRCRCHCSLTWGPWLFSAPSRHPNSIRKEQLLQLSQLEQQLGLQLHILILGRFNQSNC